MLFRSHTFATGELAVRSRRVLSVNDGKPGPRPANGTNYVAYARDPDGNKICAYCAKAK